MKGNTSTRQKKNVVVKNMEKMTMSLSGQVKRELKKLERKNFGKEEGTS